MHLTLRDRGAPDFGLLFVVIILILFGLVMVYSASSATSYKYYGNPDHLLIRQFIAALIGLGILLLLMNLDYKWLLHIDDLLLIFAVGLTLLTLVPCLSIGGRWLKLGSFGFQPSELLKLALILYVAASIVRKGDRIRKFSEGVLPYLVILGVSSILLIEQPDFGMAMIFGAITIFMLFIGGVRTGHLASCVFSALPFLYLLIFYVPYRRARIISFFTPFEHSEAEGYHLIQSLMTTGSGGVVGRGLGAGRAKFFYLPSVYNDFIFSTTGEELGLIGTLFLVFAFALLTYKGLKIATGAPDRFGSLLGAGITFALSLQAVLHLGVSIGVLPVTGLTLPFISYGGSSLITSMAMIGVLLSISKSGKESFH